MIEGDLIAGELEVPVEWLELLAGQGRTLYIEPGLWIAAEQEELYEKALSEGGLEEAASIVRRMLRYRGGQTADQIRERYFLTPERTEAILARLLEQDEIVEWEHVFYHKKLYDRARQSTLRPGTS